MDTAVRILFAVIGLLHAFSFVKLVLPVYVDSSILTLGLFYILVFVSYAPAGIAV
jgi:hypothetical protein